MVSKKECLIALSDIENDLCELEEYRKGVSVYCLYNESLDKLNQLINEHFDNPPLKFEELRVGMWVWDNEIKTYYQIKAKHILSVGGYKVLEIITSNFIDGKWIYRTSHIYFEENRFYRKQVEE